MVTGPRKEFCRLVSVTFPVPLFVNPVLLVMRPAPPIV
jgi:hypothetical protein